MTAQDEKLHRLIAKVLDLDVGVVQNKDNFFELGGDSVSALQLVRLSRKEDVHLTVDLIFQNPTISDLIKISSERARPRDTIMVEQAHEQWRPDSSAIEREQDRPSNHASWSPRVLSTTEFQKLTLFWMHYRYFWIPLPSSVDRTRLLDACKMLAMRHESLRTAFSYEYDEDSGEKEVVQVIFPSMEVRLNELRQVESLEQHCNDDTRNSIEPPVDGRPPFQAQLVTLQDSRIYLVLRFVHAQWDGCSLTGIADDLSAAYNGLPLSPVTPYSQHVCAARARRTPEAYSTWKQVLDGSRMTKLHGDNLPLSRHNNEHRSKRDGEPYTVEVTRSIPTPSVPSNVSLATLVKTAWAVTLMRFFTENTPTTFCEGTRSRAADVVFGQVTSGRGLGIPNESGIVGPCATIVPVRVRISGPTTDKFTLLHQVQEQYLQTRPYENLEFRDIVENCTSWPADTKYGSIVRFQNYEFSPTRSFDGVPCTGTLYYLPNKPSATANLAVFPLGSKLTLLMTVSNHTLEQDEAEFILDQMCGTIQELSGGEGPLHILQ